MKTKLFDYSLPKELIAQYPNKRRDHSRMLVINRKMGTIKHCKITDIINYLNPLDLLILNNTKVIPAKIYGKKATGGKLEFLFLEEVDKNCWKALIKASRRPLKGESFTLGNQNILASIIFEEEHGGVIIQIEKEKSIIDLLNKEGSTPLPPYINRNKKNPFMTKQDKNRYQTIYASQPGAIAAPTAGLHFSSELFKNIRKHNIDIAEITLHVGIGTFKPVNSDNVSDHKMHAERFNISEDTAKKITKIKNTSSKIVAVGSTSVRTLESLVYYIETF